MRPRIIIRPALIAVLLISAVSLLAAPPADKTLSVIYTASTADVVDHGLGPAFAKTIGGAIQGSAENSLSAAQMIREGKRKPDVFISSDGLLNNALLMSPGSNRVQWYATLAGTELVLAYNATTPAAAQLKDAEGGKFDWLDALEAGGVRFGRADPTTDPLGYRTLFLFNLASRYYKQPDVAKFLGDARNPQQVMTEAELLDRLASGKLDAAVIYKFEATSRKLPFIALPPEINLGSEKFADRYAQESYTTPAGVKITAAPIVFTATVPDGAANPKLAAKFVDFAVRSDDIWKQYGFDVVHHTVTGNPAYIPQELSRFIMVAHPNESAHSTDMH